MALQQAYLDYISSAATMNISLGEGLSVFPNPTKGQFILELAESITLSVPLQCLLMDARERRVMAQ